LTVTPYNVTVAYDRTAPVINARLAIDSGTSSTDGITNSATINGTVTDDSNITLLQASLNGNTFVNITRSANGSINLSASQLAALKGSVLTDGVYNLRIKAQDQYGNSSAIYSVTFTLDTTVATPAKPILSTNSDSGSSNSDQITNVKNPKISGTAEAGNTLRLFDGNNLIGQTTVGADGLWQITAAPNLTESQHQLTAKQTDLAGNTSNASSALKITIDSLAPQLQLSHVLNIVKNGTKLTGVVNGTGSGVAKLTYQWDSNAAIGVAVDNEGEFEQSLDLTGITSGSHSLTIISTDIAGNTSTKTMSVQVQLPAPPPAITAQLVRDTAPGTITNSDKITFDPRIQGTVTGQVTKLLAGFDGTAVSQYVNIFAQLQPNGTYSLSLATLNQIKGGALLDGNHTLHLIATSAAGGESDDDHHHEDGDHDGSGDHDDDHESGSYNNHGSEDDHEDDDHDGSGDDDDEDDDHEDCIGQSTAYDFTFTLDTVAPILNWVQRPDTTPLILGSKLSGSVNGTGSSAASLSYQWDSRSIVPITLNANGGFDQALDFTGINNGSHQLTLISTDLAGNTATNTFNVQAQPILDNIAPVITAALVVDSGISSSDKITNISSIKGTVTDASAIAEFKAGLDSQTPANFKSVLAARSLILKKGEVIKSYGA
jgi:hypothetical protein